MFHLTSDPSVIIMCMHSVLLGGEQQATFLLKAEEMGLTSGQHVFIPYDTLHYSLPYTNVSYPPLQNDSRLRRAYDSVLTLTVASEPGSFNKAFSDAQRNGELTLAVPPKQVGTRLMEAGSACSLRSQIYLHQEQCTEKEKSLSKRRFFCTGFSSQATFHQ